MNTEIYSLASCPGTKYSGDTITLRATPRDGIGPYYVAFKKDGIIIDPSRLGGESNPITNAPENIEITRTYTLDDVDVSSALTGTIDFSVFIRGSCPTGGGLQFDGVNDYVDVGDITAGLTTYTISVWVQPQNNSAVQGVFGQMYHSLKLLYNEGSGYYSPGIFSLWVDNVPTYIQIAKAKDIFYHVLIVATPTATSLYVDGISIGTTRAVTNNVFSGFGRSMYSQEPWGYKYFNGIIDEVLIYNRALSPTEILGLHNGSTPRNGLVLEHIYSLGNANDLSGYGNNGTPVNGPVFIPNACMDTCTVAIGCIAPVCNFVVT